MATVGPSPSVPPRVDPSCFELRDVTVLRDGHTILDGVTCSLPDTGVTVVAGPSGSGKSTLLRLLNRLGTVTAGTITWRGDDLTALEPRALRRQVAMVFQRPTMFSGSVLDNLRAVRAELDADEAADLLSGLGLASELLDQDAASLSGGEAQRVCLARALTTSPDVVLADEATSGLDPAARRLLEDVAVRTARGAGPRRVGWIWVTHDEHQIGRIADHVTLLDRGRVIATGRPETLRSSPDPRVRAALGPLEAG